MRGIYSFKPKTMTIPFIGTLNNPLRLHLDMTPWKFFKAPERFV